MNEIVLKAEKRTENGKSAAKKLRSTGRLPGVCYGAGKETVPFSVDMKEFSNLLKHGSDNIIISLDIAGNKQNVLIRELQRDYLADTLLHVDVARISMTEKIEVEVAVELTGEPLGVKEGEGVLDQSLRTIQVKCLPTDIPEHLDLDVGSLNIGDSVRVKDLILDTTKLEVLTDPEFAIASVTHAISEEDLKVQLEEEAGEPEVVGEEAVEGEEGAEETAAEGKEGEAKPEEADKEKGEKGDKAEKDDKGEKGGKGEKEGKKE